jgi:phosphohistidine phosphatase
LSLFLLHHAEAAEPGVDPQRPLTPAGRRHAEDLAARVRDRGVKPLVIWHSGKLRARQTAQAFSRICNPLAEFSAARGLQPADPPHLIADAIAGDTRDMLIVGHFPSLPKIYARLVGIAEGEGPGFPVHGIVALEPEGTGWREAWRAS